MRVSVFAVFNVLMVLVGVSASHAAPTDENQAETKEEKAEQSVPGVDVTRSAVPGISKEIEQQAKELVDTIKQRAKDNAELANREKPLDPDAIRVNYIPESIKQEIRQQVRSELRTDVVQDVLSQAKEERWGVPGVLPRWINTIKFKGDLRLRAQADSFDDDNAENVYLDYQAINESGGIAPAGEDAFINVSEDRYRMRLRARMGVSSAISNTLKLTMRLSTGDQSDPVSTNKTLGNSANRYDVVWDQAYFKYHGPLMDDYPWLTIWGGRMPSPWLSTDLIWDSDLAFEGVAANFRYNMRDADDLFESDQLDRLLFFTIGVFPLQEVELSKDDKWLFGAQIGTHMIFEDQSEFKFGVAYYGYENITGQRNTVLDGTALDFTAPKFLQKGNTLYDIRVDSDPDADKQNLWALAGEYEEVAATFMYDLASFAPIHVNFIAEYVKNIGFDKDKVLALTGIKVEENVKGYHLKLSVGWPSLDLPGNWRVYTAYKYLEQDAVLDAFTDSDFHLGGTGAKGWVLGGGYGIMENTWMSFRLLSANEIDAAPFGVDTLQLDLNAKF